MKTQSLSIDILRLDGDTQSRTGVNEDTVAEYTDIIEAAGSQWPFAPIEVFHDGSSYFVSDGFHRTLAANKAGRASVPCVVNKGTAREARIAGMLANDQHGLRPSRADRRLNVNWLLDTFKTMTQAEISKKAGVCLRTVKIIVSERKPAKVHNAPSVEAKPKGKHVEEPSGSETEIEPDDLTEDCAEADDTAPGETKASTTKPKNGTEKVSAAKLVDALTRSHIGHIARGLTAIAAANGGEGKQFNRADSGLNQTISALQSMREGEK